ncbi:TraE/TraK family type IV conjugative transfer system protein [Pseudovibrio ascidiaceicola]|uniref:TraE/TraK family type IV conjugative transfer system protein n=1 Tax=Pseudovibrio ascidiaceicola TaxID=285279 RepID=UPI003D36B32C
MKLQRFLNTWDGTKMENRWNRLLLLGFILLTILLAVLVFKKDTVVVLQPWSLTEEAEVMKSSSTQSYKEAWGWAMAMLMGNVTPASVDLVEERVGPLLHPSIYEDVILAINLQAEEIKADRVSMRFEPRLLEYEPSSNKVFVYGTSFMRAPSGTERRTDRTYEYIVEVSAYAPVITGMQTYEGRPRTARVLKKK